MLFGSIGIGIIIVKYPPFDSCESKLKFSESGERRIKRESEKKQQATTLQKIILFLPCFFIYNARSIYNYIKL